ncbi:DUF4878 domain-containing protein [Clostridium lundense]|uniref:DUF4878 domain-containing protein n=1 Tax=Clostridium lundense TaxID=319475 RepID=UPI000486DC9C|nr:DUF4878 domain-containing protein [Clostridium lundense]
MKSILKRLISVVLMTILAVSLVGCGAKPEQTAKDFLDAIKQQDINKAASLVKDNNSKEGLKYDNKEQEKMAKAIFSKLEYTLGKIDNKGDTATVKASITSLDLPKITTKLMADLLPTMMSQALSEEKVDEKKQEAMVLEQLLKSVNDPNAPKIKKDVDIKLVKVDKEWRVDADEQLLNAITGDIGSVQKKFEGK